MVLFNISSMYRIDYRQMPKGDTALLLRRPEVPILKPFRCDRPRFLRTFGVKDTRVVLVVLEQLDPEVSRHILVGRRIVILQEKDACIRQSLTRCKQGLLHTGVT